MDRLCEVLYNALKEHAGQKLAAGVSGGRDSVCLLHALVKCGVTDVSNIIAVHVNHNLRDTAARDEAFVRELCAELGVSLTVFSVDVRKESAQNKLTVEQAARTLRYGVFHELIRSGAADFVLTAHHALDNAESVLMHIFRGSGIDGLRSMSSPGILRPLLSVEPCEIEGYIGRNGLRYVTDETNFELDADRNFLRLKVIPLIEERYKGAVRAVNELSDEAGGVIAYLDGSLDGSAVFFDGDAVCIRLDALCHPLAGRYVREALKHFSLVDITRRQIELVAGLGRVGSGAVELSNGVTAVREYDRVALYIKRPVCTDAVPVRAGANYIDGLAIDILPLACPPHCVRGGAVDLDKLDGAVLRFRRDGDEFTPFGGERKKLARYFIDSKVPKRVRDRVPLICRGNEVLVVVGMQISDSVKLTDGTVNKYSVSRRF